MDPPQLTGGCVRAPVGGGGHAPVVASTSRVDTALAAAGGIGFLGNEIAALIRHRAGRRLASPALVADGNHARVDGFVSLGVVVSAAFVALGYPRADPIVGIAITLVILRITWDSWRTIRATEPGEAIAPHEH
jgi:divalent metal cation (Fe/Co/Zn/Cd) transporter